MFKQGDGVLESDASDLSAAQVPTAFTFAPAAQAQTASDKLIEGILAVHQFPARFRQQQPGSRQGTR